MKHKYFELNEFIASREAKKRGIDNTPSFEVVDNLNELVETILDPLRAAYKKRIFVRSGFRCLLLNNAVGGVPTSVHPLGLAADVQGEGDFEEFKTFVIEWFRTSGVRFDQVLLEKNKKGEEWIHIGLRNRLGQQRGQIKVLNV